MIKICFLCHGNICRSPMAEYMFKEMVKEIKIDNLFIYSLAVSTEEIGNDIYPPAKAILRKYHIPFDAHHARQITLHDLLTCDYIICMDRYNLSFLKRLFPNYDMHNVSLLLKDRDVSDPWYTGEFENCYQDIKQGLDSFLNFLKSNV